jgi:hypothetical protein
MEVRIYNSLIFVVERFVLFVTSYFACLTLGLRDMYMPECWNEPGDTYSDQFTCTTYYDGGGVHKNSGILNRLFAVIVDGGVYNDPSSTTGETLGVTGLGFTKSLNLFWRAHEDLTPTSQFMDMAIALSAACQHIIGAPLYEPNLFSSEITESTEVITDEDCVSVDAAITGSGMDSTNDFCPNIDCEVDGYDCAWKMCPLSNSQLFYEDMSYMMGQVGGRMESPCADTAPSKFVRVFEQDEFAMNDFTVSCVQFGYYMMSVTDVTVELYIDRSGGEPDAASLELVASNTEQTFNAYNRMQVQTTNFDDVEIKFNSPTDTLVVMMTIPVMTEGAIAGGGQLNLAVAGTSKETYVGGDCLTDFTKYSEWAVQNGATSIEDVVPQWYVRVSGNSAASPSADSSDDDDMSSGEIAAVATTAVVVLGLVAVIAYLLVTRVSKSDDGDINESLMKA